MAPLRVINAAAGIVQDRIELIQSVVANATGALAHTPGLAVKCGTETAVNWLTARYPKRKSLDLTRKIF